MTHSQKLWQLRMCVVSFTFGWIREDAMTSALDYRVFWWVVTPISLSWCLTLSHAMPRPHPRHRHVPLAMSLTVTLSWPGSWWSLGSVVDSAMLNALTLLFQWQPTGSVVELSRVWQVNQHLRHGWHTHAETHTQTDSDVSKKRKRTWHEGKGNLPKTKNRLLPTG